MKLKLLKSVAYSTAQSYLSPTSHIGNHYTSTVLYRAAFDNQIDEIKIDVLNKIIYPVSLSNKVNPSLTELNNSFVEKLNKNDLNLKCVKLFQLYFRIIGNRKDVVEFLCQPIIMDSNGKAYTVSVIQDKYPATIS